MLLDCLSPVQQEQRLWGYGMRCWLNGGQVGQGAALLHFLRVGAASQ
jgi:hypothetical protein